MARVRVNEESDNGSADIGSGCRRDFRVEVKHVITIVVTCLLLPVALIRAAAPWIRVKMSEKNTRCRGDGRPRSASSCPAS